MTWGVVQGDEVDVVLQGVRAVSVRNARSDQEDAVLVRPCLVAVADGMGGHADGAAASLAALTALDAAVTGPCGPDDLLDACRAADAAVRALAVGSYWNPGTTIVAAAIDPGGGVHGVWSGDSRAWLVTADDVVALTEDHADAFGGLTACLGDHGDDLPFRVDTFAVPPGPGRLLLTSDGVHGPLEVVFEDPDALIRLVDRGLDVLVAEATAAGTDNATAVLVDLTVFASPAPG